MSRPPEKRPAAVLRNLSELPQELTPARDLWPGIAAAIAAEPAADRAPAPRHPLRAPTMLVGLAASVALLAVGAWLGRSVLPVAPSAISPGAAAVLANTQPGSAPVPITMAASFALDPASRAERQRRLSALAGQLAALSPQTQAKVTASLATIEKSVLDIQSALGRDPGNLLLQEMLVNTYQDEMRVLGAVDEANRTTMESGI